jgi:hypothetical protein
LRLLSQGLSRKPHLSTRDHVAGSDYSEDGCRRITQMSEFLYDLWLASKTGDDY